MATIFISADSRTAAPPIDESYLAPRPVSYDDDLTWIVENFRRRTFADGALLTRQLPEADPETLTAAGILARIHDDVGAQLRRVAALAAAEDRLWFTGEPMLAWSECRVAGEPARVLSIPLPPQEGERIVICAVYSANSAVVQSAAEAMASRLQPVLAGYFRLWSKLRAERRRVTGLERALDVQGLGVSLLDRRGRIVFMNAVMRRWVEAGNGLRRRGDMLVATDFASALKFQLATAQAIELGDSLSEFRTAPLVSLKRPRGCGTLLVALVPIDRAIGEPSDAAVVINALDPEADAVRTLRPVCALHGLSPVETGLVVRLVMGDTITGAASHMRVKENTARAYLKTIFLKTGMSRQADLVRLMLVSTFRLHESVAPSAV